MPCIRYGEFPNEALRYNFADMFFQKNDLLNSADRVSQRDSSLVLEVIVDEYIPLKS